MSRLQEDFKTRVKLDKLAETYGELWNDAYIDIAPLTVKALPALRKLNVKAGAESLDDLADEDVKKVLTMVKAAFLGGKVVYNGELVAAEADDLEDLPIEVINEIITAATGKTDPKS